MTTATLTSTGWVITIAYSALVIVGVTIGLIVFRSTRVGFHVRTAGRETLERREGIWGIIVVTFLVVLLGATIFSIPYWSADKTNAAQKLEVTGRQYAWTVNPPRARVGLPTLIVLHAADVNHGLGIYDPDGTLIKQVNVLPGVTQNLTITFDEPGTYKLRCLEFCGVDHHLMQNELEVTR
jgi:cytochrome c oxidase subunit 2